MIIYLDLLVLRLGPLLGLRSLAVCRFGDRSCHGFQMIASAWPRIIIAMCFSSFGFRRANIVVCRLSARL